MSSTRSEDRTTQAAERRFAFISYSHDDHELFEQFRRYLDGVTLAFPRVAFQADQRVHGGQLWRDEVLGMIGRSDLFVLLISPSFLASEFIIGTELPAMRERYQQADALLLPVVLRPCLWQWVCRDIQAVPCHRKRLKPIVEWRPRDNGFVQAQADIAAAIERYYAMPMSFFDWSAKR